MANSESEHQNKAANQIEASQTKKEAGTPTELDIEEILEIIGPYGRMQKIYVFIFCLLTIPSTYQTLAMLFMGNIPDWKCVSNNTGCNMTDILPSTDKRRCHMDRKSWQYTEQKSFSIVTEVKSLSIKFATTNEISGQLSYSGDDIMPKFSSIFSVR